MSPAKSVISLFVATFALGCSVSAEDYGQEEGENTTHAVVRIQRSSGFDGSSRGDALAGFVQIPAEADADQILGLAGLSLALPKKGECWSGQQAFDGEGLSRVSRAELLEADSVELITADGTQLLAPYAFPTVADLLRGVVYLSRDRAADLPASGAYTISSRGIDAESDEPLSLESEHTSPPTIEGLAVNGELLSSDLTVMAGPVMDLTWTRSGTEGDLVVVTLDSDEIAWTCTFADAEAFGSVPLLTEDGTALGEEGKSAVLSVHRVRSNTSAPGGGLDRLTVTFDFALETDIRFGSGIR